MIFDRDIYATLSQPIVLSIQTPSILQNECTKILLEAAVATVFPDENPGWPMVGGGNRHIVSVGSITDICSAQAHVRFTPESRHSPAAGASWRLLSFYESTP